MSLTNFQLEELAEKMNFPLEGCYFKDEVPDKLEYNKCYIVNLENELDENGEPNSGSHWTCFQINKYKSGVKEGIYFDPFGVIYSEKVGKILSNHLGAKCPYVKKCVQGVMAECCGWYCAAFLHFLNSSEHRTPDFYKNVCIFLAMFDDLRDTVDFKKNEFMLKHFFRSADPSKRIPINVDSIVAHDTPKGASIDGDETHVDV